EGIERGPIAQEMPPIKPAKRLKFRRHFRCETSCAGRKDDHFCRRNQIMAKGILYHRTKQLIVEYQCDPFKHQLNALAKEMQDDVLVASAIAYQHACADNGFPLEVHLGSYQPLRIVGGPH